MGFIRNLSLFVVIVGVALVYLPKFIVNLEDYSIAHDWKQMSEPEGTFAELPLGKVHYVLEGDKNAPLVSVSLKSRTRLHIQSWSDTFLSNF